MLSPRNYALLSLIAAALALLVVVLGAYVRLSDAGLGCPDWPGCYGQLAVPDAALSDTLAEAFPDRPLETAKAWKEMVHRYAAGTLGALILVLAVLAWLDRSRQLPRIAASCLLVLVIFQAALGMWTVTLLLQPVVVTAHLLGGFATLCLLWLLALRTGFTARPDPWASGLRWFALIVLLVLIAQVALGGWTSSNYAALSCVDFPTCRGSWWPPIMDFEQAFVLWRGVGVDYEGGVLGDGARVAIHVTHRIGALVTLLAIATLGVATIRMASTRTPARLGWLLLLLLGVQLALGIANVRLGLPLPMATAHNAVAALLCLALITLLHCLFAGRRQE